MSCYYYCKHCKEYKRNSITVVRTIVSVMTTRTVLLGHQHLELNTVNQPVPANTFVKVLFQNEQFDLANEYNPATSILFRRLEVFTLLLEQLVSFQIIQISIIERV